VLSVSKNSGFSSPEKKPYVVFSKTRKLLLKLLLKQPPKFRLKTPLNFRGNFHPSASPHDSKKAFQPQKKKKKNKTNWKKLDKVDKIPNVQACF